MGTVQSLEGIHKKKNLKRRDMGWVPPSPGKVVADKSFLVFVFVAKEGACPVPQANAIKTERKGQRNGMREVNSMRGFQ